MKTAKKAFAVVCIIPCWFFAISVPVALTKPAPPGVDAAWLVGYRTGPFLFVAGLIYCVRWYMTLSGHTHKVSSQAWASIFFWYSILGISIALFVMLRRFVESAFSARSGEAILEQMYNPELRQLTILLICGVVGFACGIWKERLRAAEKTIQASAQASGVMSAASGSAG